jgi:c-di-GMP-binding flagellar brake protein YcgR
MLVEINTKLGLILNKLNLDSEGLTKAEPRQVSLSSSGVKFTTGEMFGLDDLMEVKLLLPLNPPVWIAVYGKVVRVEIIGNEQYDVALRFSDLDDEVCEAINQYTLKRQREIIRKQKEL